MSMLLLGFMIGIRHALEADHLAAVSALATGSTSPSQTVRLGVVWGVGHTLALLLVGMTAVVMGATVPERWAAWLELAVGVMLIGLGGDVIRRLVRDRIHIHTHVHQDGAWHLHAHSHRGERERHAGTHSHPHPDRFPFRALAVGLMHGMAGSAVLIVIVLANVESLASALAYLLLFGIGSIAGMAMLSAIISWPLASARALPWFHNALQAAIGVVTVVIGAWVCYEMALGQARLV